MILRANKNGNGNIGNYTFSIGAKEAKDVNFLNEDGTSKELEKIVDVENKKIIIKIKEKKIMKRIDKDFDFENRKGEKIWCVEAVSNDDNEYSIDIYECDSEETAIAECEKMNRTNQDKNLKFITIEYTVTEDSLESM